MGGGGFRVDPAASGLKKQLGDADDNANPVAAHQGDVKEYVIKPGPATQA
jgi:hypothetical protein